MAKKDKRAKREKGDTDVKVTPEKTITAGDIESKLTELKDDVETAAGAARGSATKAGIVGGVLLLLLIFFLGSRRGKRGRTVVEVRRL